MIYINKETCKVLKNSGINVYCSQNLSFLLITIWRLLLAYHYGSLIRPFLKKFCPFFTWHISSKCLYVQLVLHFKFEFFKTLHVSLLIYIKSLWQFNWTFLNNLIWFEYCNPIGWSAWRKFWILMIPRFELRLFHVTIWICRWQMNMLVTSQYQPRLSSITKISSRQISQSDCSIQTKLNYSEMICCKI
jgi:hypothetical protein